MERKTLARSMGLAQVMIGAAVTCLTGCEMLLDHKWAEFRARQDGEAGGMASGSTGSMGSGSSSSGSSGTGGAGGGGCEETGGNVGPVPSCDGGFNQSCLPNNTSNCCESPVVPCGTDMACGAIAAFRLDAYEVTVGRFKEFLDQNGYPTMQPLNWSGTWQPTIAEVKMAMTTCDMQTGSTWNDMTDNNKPLNCVTWIEASEFCKWDGGRLPTPTELRYSASGGDQNRTLPWGTPTSFDNNFATCGKGDANGITNVGATSAGHGLWNQYDLVGNVREWTIGTGCDNSTVATHNDPQIVFGGSYASSCKDMTISVATNGTQPPQSRSPETGFRCAR